jgi:hypothetical protein
MPGWKKSAAAGAAGTGGKPVMNVELLRGDRCGNCQVGATASNTGRRVMRTIRAE